MRIGIFMFGFKGLKASLNHLAPVVERKDNTIQRFWTTGAWTKPMTELERTILPLKTEWRKLLTREMSFILNNIKSWFISGLCFSQDVFLWGSTRVSKLYKAIFVVSQWMKRSKHGLYVFPPKKTPIWRWHCSIDQPCCSMTSLFLFCSRVFISRSCENRSIKHETPCFIIRWNTEKRVENTTRASVYFWRFSRCLIWCWISVECLILLLRQNQDFSGRN